MKPNPGDGLLLHRHIPPLTRRYMAYFCSGAHSHGREVADILAKALEQVKPTPFWKQSYILSERGKDATRQELCDRLRRVLQLQVASQRGELAGNLAGNLGGLTSRIEREGIEPDGSKALRDGRERQVIERDTEGARVGKGRYALPVREKSA